MDSTKVVMARKPNRRLCATEECNTPARNKSKHCLKHGGGRRCLTDGCTKAAEGKTDHCKGHGGGRRCVTDGCTKSARSKSEYCIGHGGGRRCLTDGCTKSAQGESDHCKGHGGGRRCVTNGCTKSAQGKTDHCKGHGGGRRCVAEGCTKSAQGGTDQCVGHGGGHRCLTDGCTKSARGRADCCIEHGGGRRCVTNGCTKSAQGNTYHCKGLGGGGGFRCVVCSEVSVHFPDGACYSCRSGTSLKQWEAFTTRWLSKLQWPWSYSDETLPCARAMSVPNRSCIKRPDYVFVFDTHAVVLEVDENYHRYYEVSCEVDRMGRIKDLVRLPLHFVRFNPAKKRYPLLKGLLERLFKDPEGAKNAAGVLVHFVGYPGDRIEELSIEDDFCFEYETLACVREV